MEYQLKTRQICFFFIAFLPIIKFFMLPSVLASISGEDMWLSALFSFLLDGITLAVLLLFCKKTKTDYFTLLENNFSKSTAKTVYVVYAVYFFLKALLPIIEQRDYIELSLYLNNPSFLYFLPFIIVCFYICLKHLRILGRISDILWWISLTGFLFVFGLSVSNVDFGAILPIGAQGLGKIFKGSFTTLNWYGDAVYLLFFAGKFDYGKKDGVKIGLSYLGACLCSFIFLFFFYGIFTSVAFRQRYSLTEISKYSSVINSVGRFDYIGIFCIILSAVFSVSLPIYFCCYSLSKVFNLKRRWVIPLIVNTLAFGLIEALGEYVYSIETFMLNYANVFFLIMGNVLPILSIFLKNKENNNEIPAL